MTSQVAIFNSLGVAVASDTVTTHTADDGSTKTTNNAEKIWQLGDKHRAVVLHSGAVHMNGVNLRLLVSEWSKSLPNQLADLHEYLDSFRNWMNSNADIIGKELQVKSVNFCLNDHYGNLRNKIETKANRLIDQGEELDLTEILSSFINPETDRLNTLNESRDFTMDAASAILKQYEIDLEGKIYYHFDHIEGFEDFVDVLRDHAPLLLSRPEAQPSRSLLGFVGFGSDNFFASSYRLDIRNFYGDQLHYLLEDRFGVSAGDDGAISTFAQAEAIHGFIGGSEWNVVRALARKVRHELHSMSEIIAVDEKIDQKIYDLIYEHFEEYRREQYVSPLLSTIEGLSLKGIAELAESLVGIQAIRAAGGNGPASVGGFIESLVIDRAEGVRWVKRLPR